MKYMIGSSEKVGDIVTNLPKAAGIFKSYGIDFCCGGDRRLLDVLKEQGLNEAKILESLNKAYEASQNVKNDKLDWQQAPYGQFIDYIIETHHLYLQNELPKLSQLATKILRVHGIDHGEMLSQVHKLLHSLKMELEQHLIKEEEVLFPLIRDYEKNPSQKLLDQIASVNRELEDEHDGAGDLLKKLRQVTNGYQTPAYGSCASFELTFKGLEALEWDIFQHVHLENNILFPRLEAEGNK
ncbi:iron-sulfur cluster repair di-iron protein [Natronincola ferrireducens]|uniref:Regulator of cell morphogenesis and NO signaling n=1 Tax=Natronincola ferrireducens TaxID=393762 RepID=A0A1G9H0S9_9FIRM|nr:iron-sulfur cluster repair di-iron protein [Natronincola ferrireducens]SDL06462.1 regulator of cell morphogenesis and NO signaling [Natronincola ferrireducens]